MASYVNDLWPGSPQKDSPATSRSGRSSRLSSRSRSRSSSRSSGPDSRGCSPSSSRSRSRSRPRRRSRSRSRSRRRHLRKYRRYSRSYSRSRSRSRGRRYRERYRRSRRSRSRSSSRGRSHYRRSYYAVARGRRYYGFGRTVYPEEHGRWRSRSRSRSRSRTPLRLSEKDRMELLEIAKANAAKALGTTNFDLPASLRTVPVAKETSLGAGVKFELSERLTENGTKNPSEKSPQQKNIAFSSNNSIAKPVQKTAKAAAEETSSGLPKIDKKKSPYGLWIPV